MDTDNRAASDMLEDALQQFDNIIGSGNNEISQNNDFIDEGFQGISQLLDDLRITIQAEQIAPDDNDKLLSILPKETLQFYEELFKNKNLKTVENDSNVDHKLKSENDSLTLQVSVLSDQVELQMEKMEELIEQNKDLQNKLLSTEGSLQKEIRTNTERDREIMNLREQIRQINSAQQNVVEIKQTPNVTKIDHNALNLHKNDTETLSPDEGIVHDNGDDTIDGPRLKMPIPTATSTPISSVQTHDEKQSVKFSETPKKASDTADNNMKTPRKLQADNLRAASLERLQMKQSTVANDETKISTSQSENLNLTTDNATSPKNLNAKANQKSCSSPNLATTEIRNDIEIVQQENYAAKLEEHEATPFHNRKKHGIKKFFSSFRLRRSNSSSLHASETASLRSWNAKTGKPPSAETPQQFTRGGFRSTAGPRLGVSKPKISMTNKSPFAQWSAADVSDWLLELGLDEYVENCKIWVKSGATLLQATNQDIERELGIHNPLHKKKLMLSLQAVGEEEEVGGQIIKGSGMDHLSVARWLDDVGLPQYKDAFHKARIDCRMLHHLTIGDLQKLRVTNLLHTLSLRRAIYTLRNIKFDPMQLKRRPVDTDVETEIVHLWTNHRVMEWLRSIDLAEYAPNLRGSGVHGSLMVLEPQFTGEVLASLLHIPTSKSLLRRHLTSKFNDLLPPENLTQKQKEASLNTLNVMAKVKIGRRSFGPLSRLRGLSSSASREFSSGEYVCPFETKNSGQSFGSHRRNLDTKLQMQDSKNYAWDISDEPDINGDNSSEDSGNIKIVELNESATKKIGAFSAEIATMTNKWSED